MSANFTPEMDDYEKIKKGPIFIKFVLENFPLLTDDFDAMTYYGALCKIVDYMKKLIDNETALENNMTALYNAYNQLQDYVNHYFDNLDIQEEINNKLDEMAENGQLTDIIAQYLQLAGVLAYDTKTAMKSATNLVNGSIAKTLGNTNYLDGQGAFYKVREIQNTDVVDDENIIALTDPDLVAEKIPYSNTYEIHKELENKTNKKVILITDSYGEQNTDNDITKFFWETFKENMGLTQGSTFFHAEQNGAGFGNNAFLLKLQSLASSITDKDSISDILVCGGWNDSDLSQSYGTDEAFNNGIEAFNTYVKANYTNAKVTIAHISWGDPHITHNPSQLFSQMPVSIRRYKEACNKYAWNFLNGFEYVMHYYNDSYWQSDGNHPNQNGQTLLGNELTRAFVNGSIDTYRLNLTQISESGNAEFTNIQSDIYSLQNNNICELFTPETSVGIYVKMNTTVTPTMNCDGAHEYEIATIHSLQMVGYKPFTISNVPMYFTDTSSNTYLGFADIMIHDSKIIIRPTLFANNQRQENLAVNYLWIPNFKITAPTIYS